MHYNFIIPFSFYVWEQLLDKYNRARMHAHFQKAFTLCYFKNLMLQNYYQDSAVRCQPQLIISTLCIQKSMAAVRIIYSNHIGLYSSYSWFARFDRFPVLFMIEFFSRYQVELMRPKNITRKKSVSEHYTHLHNRCEG